jgi:hypothetical protein
MPVTDASAYCEICGHAHRSTSRCRVRDDWGDRCDCTGTGRDDVADGREVAEN